MNNSAFGTIAGLENANYHHKFGTVFHTPNGDSYTPRWSAVAQAYGMESICVQSAEEFKGALEKALQANKEGRPFLVEAPMENIIVPTPGCWNINDIYTHKDNVDICNGRLKFADEMGGVEATVVRSQAE